MDPFISKKDNKNKMKQDVREEEEYEIIPEEKKIQKE
jgi:hypothetical protein